MSPLSPDGGVFGDESYDHESVGKFTVFGMDVVKVRDIWKIK
jgi:hypothetical protein